MYNQPLLSNIQSYSLELKSLLDPRSEVHEKLIQKGMILFRQQLVYGVKFSNEKVEAKVQDVTPVNVELFFDHPSNSTCTCPEQGICRHQMALFFTVLSRAQSVFVWLQEWKNHYQVADVLSTLQRGSDLLKKMPQQLEKGPEQWTERIRNAYHHVSTKNFYEFEEWARVCYKRLLGFAPVEREWKPLFQLFAACESLKVINSLSSEPKKRAHLRSFTEQMLEEADEALSKLTTTASPFAFDEYFHYLREQSHTFIEDETVFPTEFTDIYMKLWSALFNRRRDLLEEWERLKTHMEKEHDERIVIAFIHIAILLEEDDKAIEQMKNLGSNIAPYALRWMKILQTDRAKGRLNLYLPVFIDQMTTFISSLTRSYEQAQFTRALFQILDSNTALHLDSSLLEKVYLKLLPYSRFQYNEYLLEKKDYKKWAELQVYTKNSLDYIDKRTIDTIAKNDPAALKPLYHETITDLINNRSRDSYKRAVRYLKRLQKLYQKEKKLKQWELYLSTLLHNTKRLRAFQEECIKGKLVKERI
ncbi:SWIM zinc finger domain-containing protein [Lederbergia wuyishanensis]|uniref:SWIM-type domain-containing protein n=1 Tax=Lederbergia wuyishanensis TaxID=1347903 RepID=A0ABU0D3A8_9BACI|nr:SWIM zinc finger family protein [Lederbergia wuyishanensis]MCJ8007950.1 hypothetical protein [Lederbergia wuyishanensis]MDQ0342882.1 hypothetical protein [Lederbergia wuyishanensis]